MPGRPVSLAMRIKDATMRTQPTGMFARFTDQARGVIFLAQEEARLLRHDYVGTEHLLLGLLYEGEGVAARALESLGISREDVQGQVEEIAGPGQGSPARPLPFTPPAKKVLELSLREALALGHHYIGTEHLLLGLLREGDGVSAQVLTRLGTGDAQVREQVLGLLRGESEQAALRCSWPLTLPTPQSGSPRYGGKRRPRSTRGTLMAPQRCATRTGSCSPRSCGWRPC